MISRMIYIGSLEQRQLGDERTLAGRWGTFWYPNQPWFSISVRTQIWLAAWLCGSDVGLWLANFL